MAMTAQTANIPVSANVLNVTADLSTATLEQMAASPSRMALSSAMAQTAGQGQCIGHHGELFQGVLQAPDGHLQRCLLTLPCPGFYANARFTPSRTSRHIDVLPGGKPKARNAARRTLDALGLHNYGGLLMLSGNIPDARGYGASTADVVAAIRAVAEAFAARLAASDIAGLAVASETASDSLMFTPAALFAYREGTTIETYAAALPEMEVLGFDTEPGSPGIDTLKLPPARYNQNEISQFQTLLALLRQALAGADIAALGQVASASAHINQRFLPTTHFDVLEAIAAATGAAGLQVAHSGTVAGLLYDPSLPRLDERIATARSVLHGLNCGHIQQFSTRSGA